LAENNKNLPGPQPKSRVGANTVGQSIKEVTMRELSINLWRSSLTTREYQVALLVSGGLSNKEVARELGLCDGTVKLHVHNILNKLGAKNRCVLIKQCNGR
jgi:two-component system nitrate/nitrite response regulator NarL